MDKAQGHELLVEYGQTQAVCAEIVAIVEHEDSVFLMDQRGEADLCLSVFCCGGGEAHFVRSGWG